MILIYKPIGLTPLQAIVKFKQQMPAYTHATISYAGRLDPMAEGLLLLLIDDENKKRKEFENLTKTYHFTALLGVETDTYDILGKVASSYQFSVVSCQKLVHQFSVNQTDKPTTNKLVSENRKPKTDNRLTSILSSFVGKRLQKYPPYSSKTVGGKPLYWWARQGRLDEITIPSRQVEISSLELVSVESITPQNLHTLITTRINLVQGDFRQKEILKGWNKLFNNRAIEQLNNPFSLLNCSITCSSGTYVRTICHELGQKLGCGAIALTIQRTQIGSYDATKAMHI